jgi:thiol-disulfide isomerase/thioredoxin
MIRYFSICMFVVGSIFLCCGAAFCKNGRDEGGAPIRAKGSIRLHEGPWHASLARTDGNSIVFNFDVKDSAGRQIIYIRNADERLLVDDIKWDKDSVVIRLPFFESQLRAKWSKDGRLNGVWLKRLADSYQSMAFEALWGVALRFPDARSSAANIGGRWAADFGDRDKGKISHLVGEFTQAGNRVTGTFLDPTGDYRYLEGVVSGDSLRMSCFDGGHAYLFTGKIVNDSSIVGGKYFSGPVFSESWKAIRDPNAKLPDEFSLTKWKKDSGLLDFSFPDINGHRVSFRDKRFEGKVVLVQIMGSWCPNCMDETRFLSEFYDRYRGKGVEIVGLAYERSTDFERSAKSLRAFQQRFGVKYPLLVTGVTVDDPMKAEKTLPQLEAIVGFPTTIFVDRQGRIAKIHTGFNGPGTGGHYEEQKKEFEQIVDGLLGE